MRVDEQNDARDHEIEDLRAESQRWRERLGRAEERALQFEKERDAALARHQPVTDCLCPLCNVTRERDEALEALERGSGQQVNFTKMSQQALKDAWAERDAALRDLHEERSRANDYLEALKWERVAFEDRKVRLETAERERDRQISHAQWLNSKLDDTHTHRCFKCEGTVTEATHLRQKAEAEVERLRGALTKARDALIDACEALEEAGEDEHSACYAIDAALADIAALAPKEGAP